MKKVILMLALLAATITTSVFAQAGKDVTPAERADKMVARLKEKLALSDDQAAKLKPVFEQSASQAKELRAGAKEGTDRKETREKMKAIKSSTDEQVKAILTAEQYTKYQELKDDAKDKVRARRGR